MSHLAASNAVEFGPSLDWPGGPLHLRRAELSDVPTLVQLSRDQAGQATPHLAADNVEAWFVLGGPWHHPYTCERHLTAYARHGGEIWLVLAADDRLVGSLEIWYDDEPEPFGRYGHIELLELRPDFQQDAVEMWLIDFAEARARRRGLQRFWCRPVGSGGSLHLLIQRGYVPRWANAQVTLRQLHRFQPPPHQLTPLTGDYASEAVPLLALNHREAAGYRWHYLWRVALDPANADMPRSTSLWGGRVQFASGGGGLLLLSQWPWYSEPAEARVDLWVAPESSADRQLAANLLAVAAAQAAARGAASLISYLPKALALALDSEAIAASALDQDDPWYLKVL